MKAILISIKPEYVAKILNGEKTIEIRKNMPKCDLPIDVYVYCTKDRVETLFKQRESLGKEFFDYACISKKGNCYDIYKNEMNLNGKVVAKFTLRKIKQVSIWDNELETETLKPAYLDFLEFDKYTKGQVGYAWHIDNLVIFDKPKELSEFKTRHYPQFAGMVKNKTHYELRQLTKAPQSYMFVEIEK